jgi:hypothetical protein
MAQLLQNWLSPWPARAKMTVAAEFKGIINYLKTKHINPLICLHSLAQYSQILTHPFLAMSYTFQRLYSLWPIEDLEKLYKSHRSTVESSARTFPARSLLTALV